MTHYRPRPRSAISSYKEVKVYKGKTEVLNQESEGSLNIFKLQFYPAVIPKENIEKLESLEISEDGEKAGAHIETMHSYPKGHRKFFYRFFVVSLLKYKNLPMRVQYTKVNKSVCFFKKFKRKLIYGFTKYIYSFMKFVLNGPNSKFVINYYAIKLSYSLRNLLTMN